MDKNKITEKDNHKLQEDDFFTALGDSISEVKSAAELERERMVHEIKEKEKAEEQQEKKVVEKSEAEKFEEELIKNKPVSEEVAGSLSKLQETGKYPVKEVKKIDDEVSFEGPKVIKEEPKKEVKEEKPVIVTKEKVEEPKKEPLISIEVPEKKEEEKPKERKVKVLSPEEMEEEQTRIKKGEPVEKKSHISSGDKLIDFNLDEAVYNQNREILMRNRGDDVEDKAEQLTMESINTALSKNYEDKYQDDDDIKVSIIEPEPEIDEKTKKPKQKKVDKSLKEPEKLYHGGDGIVSSFKVRSSKISKIVRKVDIEDTDTIEATDISKKPMSEQQNIYLNAVLPTLQPSYSVVPFIISGVVITMTGFAWTDILEICKIEEQIYDTLDPSDDDYIYQKNKIFLEKRRKQIDIFYSHIFSVSGFDTKPSKEDLFGKIIRYPDFQQLFFAAYAASFHKPYTFTITCSTCNSDQEKSVHSKDLCFILNKNINLDSLNHYITKGSSLAPKETHDLYNQFQSENLVEMAKATYRTSKKLPISSFIYEMKVPTVLEALDMLDEVVEKFRTKELEITDPNTGDTVSVDSSNGLMNSELLELKAYLYFKTLIITQVVSENSEDNSAKVGFVSLTDKSTILESIYNLSSEDYKVLMSDEKLFKLLRIEGIRHSIKAGICDVKACGVDMGLISVEPESLFFTIAQHDLIS